MSTTTANIGLTKPAGVDVVDIDIINDNMDLIDAAFGTNNNSLTELLDDVRLYNGTDALYCKEGMSTGLLMKRDTADPTNDQIQVVNVT